ncbi:hypothetical protein D3C77_648860 [compost metagenome]
MCIRDRSGAGYSFPEHLAFGIGDAQAQGAGFFREAMDGLVGPERVGRRHVDVKLHRRFADRQPVIHLQCALGGFPIATLGKALA